MEGDFELLRTAVKRRWAVVLPEPLGGYGTERLRLSGIDAILLSYV
jgi:hypothetical protein